MNSKTVRILTPGLALGAAILAGALLAADRPTVFAEAPEQVRVRLVSAMAKWRGCLLRVVETRRAEGLRLIPTPDHGPLALVSVPAAAAAALLFLGLLLAPARPGHQGFRPVHAGRAPPLSA